MLITLTQHQAIKKIIVEIAGEFISTLKNTSKKLKNELQKRGELET